MSISTISRTQATIIVSHASRSDHTSLAAIIPLATAGNPIDRFMFRYDSRHEGLPPPSHRWAMKQFREGEQSHLAPGGPRTHILKAVVEGQEEPIGFAIIRVFSGGGGRDGAKKDVGGTPENEVISGAAQGIDLAYGAEGEQEIGDEDGLNHDFCNEWTKQMKNLYKLHMDGIKHAYWSTLMILPHWQRHGVGSAIGRWAQDNLHLDALPVWVNAMPNGYELYKRFGWHDVGNIDVDLSKWAGPNKGYGMHRTVCMLRNPTRKNE